MSGSLFLLYLDGFGRAAAGANAAGNALERIEPALKPAHGLGGADRHAHHTANAQLLIQQYHALRVDFQGQGGTGLHAYLALIADIDFISCQRF